MSSRQVDARTAWEALLKLKETRWGHNTARFGEGLAEVVHEPGFQLSLGDKFFCIGSCFARNIEEHLIYNGADVISRSIVSPPEEWGARPNGFVNKFTTASMLNELDFVIDPPDVTEILFEETTAGWLDLQLCPGVRPVSLARAIERRQYLTTSYFARLRQADVVILTLGLVEVWEDLETARFLNAAPAFSSVKREPDRYRLHILDVQDNLDALEQIHHHLHELNRQMKMIVTVSPVPMSETFSGQDVLMANTYSKSVLRSCAEIFAAGHADVDYFPSFDMISATPRALAYGADCIHVTDAVVGKVIRKFLREYLGAEPADNDFNEMAYLAANPDIEAAVRRAEFASGYHHWLAHGRSLGLATRPEGGPTPLMVLAGAV